MLSFVTILKWKEMSGIFLAKRKKKNPGPRRDSVEDVGMLYIGEKKDISHTSVPPLPK